MSSTASMPENSSDPSAQGRRQRWRNQHHLLRRTLDSAKSLDHRSTAEIAVTAQSAPAPMPTLPNQPSIAQKMRRFIRRKSSRSPRMSRRSRSVPHPAVTLPLEPRSAPVYSDRSPTFHARNSFNSKHLDTLSPVVIEGTFRIQPDTSQKDHHDHRIVLCIDSFHLYKLKNRRKEKERVATSEMWVIDEDESDSYLIVGWPIKNIRINFEDHSTKRQWRASLNTCIHNARSSAQTLSSELSCSVHFQETSVMIPVTPQLTAQSLFNQAADKLGFDPSIKAEFKLWCRHKEFSSDEKSSIICQPFFGNELIFICMKSAFAKSKEPSPANQESFLPIAFFICRSDEKPNIKTEPEVAKKARRRKGPFGFGRTKSTDDLDCLVPATSLLFGVDLDTFSGQIPTPILDITRCLFCCGLRTEGVFRKAANYRLKVETKAKLDRGEQVDLKELSHHLLADLLKDFLRLLPSCLLLSCNYHKWIEAAENPTEAPTIIKRLIEDLPDVNKELSGRLFVVLAGVVREQRSQISAKALATCLAPSILFPSDRNAMSQGSPAANCVVAFLIENVEAIFEQSLLQSIMEDFQAHSICTIEVLECCESKSQISAAALAEKLSPSTTSEDSGLGFSSIGSFDPPEGTPEQKKEESEGAQESSANCTRGCESPTLPPAGQRFLPHSTSTPVTPVSSRSYSEDSPCGYPLVRRRSSLQARRSGQESPRRPVSPSITRLDELTARFRKENENIRSSLHRTDVSKDLLLPTKPKFSRSLDAVENFSPPQIKKSTFSSADPSRSLVRTLGRNSPVRSATARRSQSPLNPRLPSQSTPLFPGNSQTSDKSPASSGPRQTEL